MACLSTAAALFMFFAVTSANEHDKGYGYNLTGDYDPLEHLPDDIRDQILQDGKNKSGHHITIGGNPWGHIPGPGEIFKDITEPFRGGGGSEDESEGSEDSGGDSIDTSSSGGDDGSSGGSSSGGGGGGGGFRPRILPPGIHIPGPPRVSVGLGRSAEELGSGIDTVVDGVSDTVKSLFKRADATQNNGDARDGRRITGPAVPTDQVPYLDTTVRGKHPERNPVGNKFDWEKNYNDNGRISEAADVVRVYGAVTGEPTDHVEGMRIDEEGRPYSIQALPLPSLNGSSARGTMANLTQPLPLTGNLSNATAPAPSAGVQDPVLPPLAVVADAAAGAGNGSATERAIASAIASQLADAAASQNGTKEFFASTESVRSLATSDVFRYAAEQGKMEELQQQQQASVQSLLQHRRVRRSFAARAPAVRALQRVGLRGSPVAANAAVSAAL